MSVLAVDIFFFFCRGEEKEEKKLQIGADASLNTLFHRHCVYLSLASNNSGVVPLLKLLISFFFFFCVNM